MIFRFALTALIGVTAVSTAAAQTQPALPSAAALCYYDNSAYSVGALSMQAGKAYLCISRDGEVPNWRAQRGPSANSCSFEGASYSSGAILEIGERQLHCCGSGWTVRRGTCDEIQSQ